MRLTAFISVLGLITCSVIAHADALSAVTDASDSRDTCARVTEADRTASSSGPTGVGSGIVFDEHLLTDARRDQDYNGGGEFTFSGRSGGVIGRTLDRALGAVDERLCPRGRFSTPGWESAYAFAAGLLIFTPRDLSAHQVIPGDRPYASLFFVSAGRRYVSSDADVAYNSSLTAGMLGLAAARSVQDALHHLSGSVKPEGWRHQISAGGEPTIRYSTARQALLAESGAGAWRGDTKWTVAASAGTVTEGSIALSTRWGRIESPWWGFTPEENTYVQETQPLLPPLAAGAPVEVFAFAGARAKARVYDAFLEGQFRHSDLTHHWGDLNPLLGEAWAGVEVHTSSGWAVQYLARLESPELRSGVGSRTIFWGSVQMSRTFH